MTNPLTAARTLVAVSQTIVDLALDLALAHASEVTEGARAGRRI